MGNTTVGGKTAIIIGPFTAVGQDTGPITNSGSLNPAWPGAGPLFLPTIPVQTTWPFTSLVYALGFRGFTKHNFQLVGAGTGFAITVYYTLDRDTAQGTAAVPQWTPVVAQSDQAGYSWQNPLTMLTPDPASPTFPVGASLYTSLPVVAFRMTSSLAPGASAVTGNVSVELHSAQ